ncbi:YidC/Oxa1 family membrane protein insertase [Acholeplasma hippikon]|uniref:Membrane protein YidC 1 n=1 Tax=Acholeplasma hippikon TaxID=264636 RepID=A0A449BKQ0_9MOLU|nr:YidC/Oxa1 family membrane protein insertase [Acholeplasma hippikon]VEU83038.1 Membrane protein YidC 1 [Acholeplasma hippikon]
MRKILALITVLVFGLVIVACAPKVEKTSSFISPNKIVYGVDELNGTKPNVKEGDFDYYYIYSNKTVAKQTVSINDVKVELVSNNIYTITYDNASYKVYAYDETATNKDTVVLATLSATYGITDEDVKANNVKNLFFTVIANKVDLDGISIISATYGAENNDEITAQAAKDVVIYPENYDENVYKTSSENNLVFPLEDLVNESITIKNLTYKPADNQLPINFKMKNSWLGYVWDYVLIIPIAFIMSLFAGIFGNSFAVGILFATIIVRTIAWPIYARANDMSMKMALAQPDLNRLQAKYATKKDPASQQKMQMEMMAIYKKHKISMLGCLTPLMQMPIFLAMFQVVYRISVPGGAFVDKISNKTLLFGTIDLTIGGWNDVWSYILAAIVGVTMYLLQRLSTKKPSYAKNTGSQVKTEQQLQQEQTMKTVSIVMVGMMVLTTITSVNALGFYWVVGNIYSIFQSIINRKLSEKKYQKTKATQSIV